MQGKLITFEGIDFSGKSLQARLLAEKLMREGYPVVLLREPGSTEISEKIRTVLLDVRNRKMVKEAEVLLYSAARTQMVTEQIIPSLTNGEIVICDRFYDSTTAYQGYGREIDLEFIHKLNNFVTHGIRPDLTLLVDLAPEIALKRNRAKEKGLDRLEEEDIAFHNQVRRAYLRIANSDTDKDRFIIVDGNRPVDDIHQEIYAHIENMLEV